MITSKRVEIDPYFLALQIMNWTADTLIVSNVARETKKVAHPCPRPSSRTPLNL